MAKFVDAVVASVILLLSTGCNSLNSKNGMTKGRFGIDIFRGPAESSNIPSYLSERGYFGGLRMTDGDFSQGENKGNESNNEKAGRFPYSPDITDNLSKSVAAYNWKYGLCAHKVVFEATETIKKMRFCGDLLAFAMMDGRVSLIRMSTGAIIDKFKNHQCEVTALDFDGINLISGAIDGSVCVCRPNYASGLVSVSPANPVTPVSSTEVIAPQEIESIENIISNSDEDISVSSTSSSTSTSKSAIPTSFSTSKSIQNKLESNENNSNSNNQKNKSLIENENSKTKTFSDNFFQFTEIDRNSLHTKRITGIKILRQEKASFVTCSLDKKLTCVDAENGVIKYTTVLDGIPLCMSVDESGGYIVLGFLDGRVQFFSGKNGRKIMEFSAHKKKVQSVFLENMSVLLTGGSDGVIKRWDLSGDGQKKETEIIRKTDQSIKSTKTEKTEKFENILKNDVTPESEKSMSSTVVIEVPRRRRFLDFYFQDAITAENIRIKSSQSDAGKTVPINGKIKRGNAVTATVTGKLAEIADENFVVYEDSEQTSAVVAIQGDSEKIVAAYSDGTVRAWDVLTRHNRYDLKGRSQHTSCLQYDATRLLVDGTHGVVVMHDFSTTPLDGQTDDLEYIMNKADEESEKDDSNRNDGSDGRDEDDGVPSSTS